MPLSTYFSHSHIVFASPSPLNPSFYPPSIYVAIPSYTLPLIDYILTQMP